MSDDEQIAELLRAEMRAMAKSVGDLTVGLAIVDQRMELTRDLQKSIKHLEESINHLDRRLIKVSGLNGDNGQLSDIATKMESMETKLNSLLLSRAALAGYAAAAGGAAASVVKFLL